MTDTADAGPVPTWRSIRHPITAAVLTAAVLQSVWALFLATGGGDLAAQDAWAQFAERNPGSAYNMAWYGGMHPASYSVIAPYLMAVFGVLPVAVVAGTTSAGFAAALLMRSGITRPMPPALWAAVCLSFNVISGRVTFALGVAFALATVLMVCGIREPRISRPQRAVAATSLGVLTTLASPLAGLFLGVVAAALFFIRRRRSAYALAAAPAVVFAASALLFPFEGKQQMPAIFLLGPLTAAAALAFFAPKSWRIVRIGAAIYAAGVVLAWLIPSQVGTNVERLALLFGGVLLLTAATHRRSAVLYLAFAAIAIWQVAKPIDDLSDSVRAAALSEESSPLIEELRRLGADRGRVEVVPSRTHRESTTLAPHVNLARGWNRQADVARNPMFYDETLTAEGYRGWLHRWAVQYVVLPEAEPDFAAKQEAQIVAADQPWLQVIWTDRNWRLYRVADPVPLADPPASVQRASEGELEISVPSRGTYLLRIPWSPWLGILSDNEGCLSKTDAKQKDDRTDEWTQLTADGPGTYRIGARYRLPRGTPCAEDKTP